MQAHPPAANSLTFSPEGAGKSRQNREASAPNFTHKLRHDRGGRKGQLCRLVNSYAHRHCIEFEDGLRMVVSATSVIRNK